MNNGIVGLTRIFMHSSAIQAHLSRAIWTYCSQLIIQTEGANIFLLPG